MSLVVENVSVSEKQIRVTFNVAPPSIDPLKWSVTGGASPLEITKVTLSGKVVTITTEEHQNGANYNIVIAPGGVFHPVSGLSFLGPVPFVGVGVMPQMIFCRALNATTVEIAFSEPMSIESALDVFNYSITPPLVVKSVKALSSTRFLLITEIQSPSVIYTLTAVPTDVANNPA